MANSHITFNKMQQETGLEQGKFQAIVHNDLEMKNVWPKWVNLIPRTKTLDYVLLDNMKDAVRGQQASSAHYWNQNGMPKSKIMIGIPTYAHTYILLDPKYHGLDAPATGSNGDLNFYDVCKFLSSGGIRVFDNESLVPYTYSGYDWISYEDQISIKLKANWIKSQGFGGAMTYKLNSDDWPCACSKIPFLLHQIVHDVFTL
ncbi:acidic mammalian chitinase-like [Stegodyphus dumicola]|uniref:acidic mammalian chitinase-like n=1 Tax=Stegodyphus dumicola TaxID=202533 RepID=UPI0015B06259|nr:acidic mammalian chitinase-like [Stegodyphus dumicola]